jgi:hypothetical protein
MLIVFPFAAKNFGIDRCFVDGTEAIFPRSTIHFNLTFTESKIPL